MAQELKKIFITKLSERSQFASIIGPNVTLVPAISFLHVTPTGFHNLPVNYLIKLFQYLSRYDLEKNIMLVCSHWRYAATRPPLWKHIRISDSNTPRAHIMNKLRNFTDVEHLHLENLADLNPIILQACRCLKKLKHLKLRKCSKLCNSSLNYIILTHNDLESIDLAKTKLEDNDMCSKFARFKSLRSLNLSHVPDITIKNLMEAVVNCHYLEELKISNIKTPKVYLTDDDACFIISKISGTLRSLSIDCTSLTNLFFCALYECSNLTRLCLYGARNMTGEAFLDLWYFLPQLKEFKLRNAHHITSEDIIALFNKNNNSQTLRKLTLLDLTGCWKLNDEAARNISTNCPQLKSLTLKCCKRLTDLSILCHSLTHLTYLNVAFCVQMNYSNCREISMPTKLKQFIIHLDLNTINLIIKIQEDKSNVQIYIAQSEYNKTLVKYNNEIK